MAQFSLNEDQQRLQLATGPVTPYDDDPQSSPGEIMDTSPLPNFGRRTLVRSISMFESESDRTNVTTTNTSGLRRPALVTRQPFSSFSLPNVPGHNTNRKAFLSGKENDTLKEQFEESPKKDIHTRPPMHGAGRILQESLSPSIVNRQPLLPVSVNAMHRRLPQFRRTQSMVTKHDEFLGPDLILQTPRSMTSQHCDMTSPISPEQQSQECRILPSFESRADQMRRISGVTFARVLEGEFRHMYDDLVIIDCRFPHEFSGGHIPNAINISSLEAMDNHALLTQPVSSQTLIVLHCEYSAHRAPRIALHLRNRDRMMNSHRYPALHYPEVYILEGGYSLFYREHRHLIGSQGYVEMNDPTHKPFASKQMHDFRKNTKFQRTQSYTFGQKHNVNFGGQVMQREENFKLNPPVKETEAPHFLSAQNRSQSAVQFEAPHRIDVMLDCDKSLGEEDSFGDSSMMDLDDPSLTSPLPNYANTASNNFHRTHARSLSGRIDPRRLTSF